MSISSALNAEDRISTRARCIRTITPDVKKMLSSPRAKQLTPWIVVVLVCALIALLPLWHFHQLTGHWIPTILPQLSSDSLFYLAQIREVLDGHTALGNAFVREYANTPYPGPRLALLVGALPGLLGLGINEVFVANTLLYHLLTGGLFYVLFLSITNKRRVLSAGTAIFGTASLHLMLMRPTMQLVYPALIVFLLSLLGVLKNPRSAWRYLGLGVSAAVAFYLYPHLWMMEFSAIGLLLVRLLWLRDWKAVRLYCLMGAGIVLLCLPQIITTVNLFSSTDAMAVNFRLGMVETHRVLPITFLNLKYLFLLLAGCGLIRLRRPLTNPELLILFSGAGIIMTAMSNVVTGKELDLETHPLWIAFGLNVVGIAVFGAAMLEHAARDGRNRMIAAVLAAAFFFTTSARIARQSFTYLWRADPKAYESLQELEGFLSFLRTTETEETVVLAPSLLSLSLALYTNHYPLYSAYSAYLLIPNEEQMERWLVRYSGSMDPALVEDGIYEVKGGGPRRKALYENAYGGNAKPIDMLGGDTYIADVLKKAKEVDATYTSLLRKYGAQYLVTDSTEEVNPRIPSGATVVYQDERFVVYNLENAQ